MSIPLYNLGRELSELGDMNAEAAIARAVKHLRQASESTKWAVAQRDAFPVFKFRDEQYLVEHGDALGVGVSGYVLVDHAVGTNKSMMNARGRTQSCLG